MSTELLERTETTVDLTTGNVPRKYSHVVVPASEVTRAYIEGTPVTALCGYTWVPSEDPEKYDICPRCAEILQSIRNREHEG